MEELKRIVIEEVERRRQELISMSDWMKDNPEIGHREYRSAWLLSSYLENEGFIVERNLAGMETAFRARSMGTKKRPVVALLAEYDALPEIGHACGHNIIASSTVGAATSLMKLMSRVEGTLVVLGCPAEEAPIIPSHESTPHKPGGKAIMVDEGVFDDVDFVMMVHPAGEGFNYMKRSSSASSTVLQISFIHYPKSSKASVSKAVAEMSSRIGSLKDDLSARTQIAVERTDEWCDWTEMRIRVIAPDVPTVTRLSHKIIFEAEKAAQKAEVSMHHRYYMNTYADMIWNTAMSEAFRKNLIELGEQPVDHIDRPNRGDEGNVSHVVPSICTWINASESPVASHAKEFAEATITDAGHEAIILGAKALAMTAIDLFTDRVLVKEAISEFSNISTSRFSEIQLRNRLSVN